ncbi:MAG TPA: ribonuclease P protein component [Beijerinckiaceae bacterium]
MPDPGPMPGPGARPVGRSPAGRLTKRRDFLAAASGRRFHTERMTVQGLARDDRDGLRFGLTVTKKVGHATERNRIRRRLRTAIDRAAVDHQGRNADVVVIGRRPILAAPHELLVEDLRRALAIVTKPRSAPGSAGKPATPAQALPTDGERRGSPHA